MDVEGGESEGNELTEREQELEKSFDAACAEEWVETAEINDILHRMTTYLPQRMWLELSGCHGVCEVCPLLSVHFLLGIPFETLSRAFHPNWGHLFKWPSLGGKPIFLRRSTNRDGLKLNYRKGTTESPHAIWLWMDRSGAPPYRGPGDDYPKRHIFRKNPWHLQSPADRAATIACIEPGEMYGCRDVPEGGWASSRAP